MGRRKGDLPWAEPSGSALLLFACLHLSVPAAPTHLGDRQTSGLRGDDQIRPEFARKPARQFSHQRQLSRDRGRCGLRYRLPFLDVVLVKQRLYEPPTSLRFAVVTPFDPDNREAGVELRCNSRAVTSTIWALDGKSNTVREFDWKIIDETCLYELVAVLVRTKDYLYCTRWCPAGSRCRTKTRCGSSDEEAGSEAR